MNITNFRISENDVNNLKWIFGAERYNIMKERKLNILLIIGIVAVVLGFVINAYNTYRVQEN